MLENVHPLEGGSFRRKSRRGRRHGLPCEGWIGFYARYVAEIGDKAWRYWSLYRSVKAIHKEVLAAPDCLTYADIAIAPPQEDELDTLDLYHATSGGEAALARQRRHDAIRARVQLGPAEPAVLNVVANRS
jgi:hypothetical protein